MNTAINKMQKAIPNVFSFRVIKVEVLFIH
jgi:hypothetical protein